MILLGLSGASEIVNRRCSSPISFVSSGIFFCAVSEVCSQMLQQKLNEHQTQISHIFQ
jgi:hypothetical protein